MTRPPQVLAGLRILSLALNLPGPAALMRCQAMGAACTKFEPPAGDPMRHYEPAAYAQMHAGVAVRTVDLKAADGLAALHEELARTDVLLTSFRPSALAKLGLGWQTLHERHPALSQVAIVGAPGAQAEEPGHDLTYLSGKGLVPGLELPATLYADMGGSLLAVEAVLQAALLQRSGEAQGLCLEVALSAAAAYAALPRHWGLTQPTGAVGGAHAGYRIYPCRDGRVALAALEPHFARRVCALAGVAAVDADVMHRPATREAVAAFMAAKTCEELERLAVEHDLPLDAMRD